MGYRKSQDCEVTEPMTQKEFVEQGLSFDSPLHAICIAGPDGWLRQANMAFRNLGFSADHLGSMHLSQLLQPEVEQLGIELLEKILAHDTVVECESRWQYKPGSYRWFHWRAVQDKKSRLVYAIADDITVRKTREVELQQTEARFRLLVESANDIIYETDVDGYFTYFNTKAVEVTGYSRADLEGMHFLRLIRPDHRENAAQFYLLQREQKIRSTYYEYPVVTKGDKVIWFGQYVQLVAAGDEVDRFCAVARDITVRKEMEEILAENETIIRSLLESVSQAVFAIDETGRIQFTNYMAEEMFGYGGDEFRNLTIDALVPKRFQNAHRLHQKDFFNKVRKRPMGVGMVLAARRKDGTEFPIEVGLNHIKTRDGLWGVSFVTDISERIHVEKTIRDREKLRSIAEGLLRGQEGERRRLARELHDDVNQRIAMVSVELGMLTRRPDVSKSLQVELDRIRGQTTRLSELVRGLSHNLHPAELEHLGLISALRDLCSRFTELERVQTEFVVAGNLHTFSADAGIGLYRVAQEALRNVVKHAKTKTAQLTLEELEIGFKLTVTDEGEGFLVGSSKGGLGLISMQERLELLGGRMDIRSAPGKGTTVIAFVPRVGENT
jgi:PAS domain S-box-containing protein